MNLQEIEQEIRRGVDAAKARGLKVASGDFSNCPIAFCCSYEPDERRTTKVARLFGVSEGWVWAFIWGFDDALDLLASEFPDAYALGQKFRKQEIGS